MTRLLLLALFFQKALQHSVPEKLVPFKLPIADWTEVTPCFLVISEALQAEEVLAYKHSWLPHRLHTESTHCKRRHDLLENGLKQENSGVRAQQELVGMTPRSCWGTGRTRVAAECKLPLTPLRMLSIASRGNAKSLRELLPIRTPRPTCANQDA